MTNEERCIKFETALDIVRNVYSDYCKDETPGRQLPPWFHSLPLSQSLAECTEPPHTIRKEL